MSDFERQMLNCGGEPERTWEASAWSPGLLDQGNRLVLRHDHFARDRDLADLLLVRHLIHQIEHQLFDDHPEAARADLPLERRLRDRFERIVAEAQLDVL